jgi:hypothetical protein
MTQDQTKEYEFLMNKLLHLENIIEQYKLQQDKQDNSNLIYHDRDLTDAISFDTGDTAWMLIASILVLLMTTPGIMLYYGGMVRLQNVLSTAMQGFSIACLVTFLWMAFGYSLVFAPINSTELSLTFMGNSQRFWLDKMTTDSYHSLAPNIPETIFCTYHLAFAIVTPSLICGAFADRMKFFSLLLCISLWHLGVYCPMAHMIWHPSGFLMKQGRYMLYIYIYIYLLINVYYTIMYCRSYRLCGWDCCSCHSRFLSSCCINYLRQTHRTR